MAHLRYEHDRIFLKAMKGQNLEAMLAPRRVSRVQYMQRQQAAVPNSIHIPMGSSMSGVAQASLLKATNSSLLKFRPKQQMVKRDTDCKELKQPDIEQFLSKRFDPSTSCLLCDYVDSGAKNNITFKKGLLRHFYNCHFEVKVFIV